MQRGNFHANLPDASKAEATETLSAFPGSFVSVERIVSDGQTTPPGEWYEQEWAEWVMIVKGSARLEFENPAGQEVLGEGDWLFIPARRRHRVAFTDCGTIWLAVHGGAVEQGKAHV